MTRPGGPAMNRRRFGVAVVANCAVLVLFNNRPYVAMFGLVLVNLALWAR